MDVAKVFLNNIPERKVPAWHFQGDYWTKDIKEQVNQIMLRHVEYEQSGGFNSWIFYMSKDGTIVVDRISWDRFSYCKDLEEFGKFMERYYVW